MSSSIPDARQRFERLMKENEAVMLRVARRMCAGDWDRAQDLVQDALINGYRAFVEGGFREGSNARAWLLKILTNVFLNDIKRRKREAERTAPSSDDADDRDIAELVAADSSADPAVFSQQISLDEPLEKALSKLSDEFRSCVILVDVEGLEYAEAAEALGIPMGTVRSRLARARLQLHALLYDYAKDLRRV